MAAGSNGRTIGGVSVPATRPRAHERVAVVSDQHLTNEALRAALTVRGFEVRGAAVPTSLADVRELQRQFAAFQPGAGLMLQELLDPLHIRRTMRIMSETQSVRWLLLTGSPEGAHWGAGLAAGAAGVLPMTICLRQLADALDRLFAGEDLMVASDRERYLDQWRERGAEQRQLLDRLERLTPREAQVLRELQLGHNVSEIAENGGLSVGTIRSQVKSVLRKLEVTSQLAAVAVLQRVGDPGSAQPTS